MFNAATVAAPSTRSAGKGALDPGLEFDTLPLAVRKIVGNGVGGRIGCCTPKKRKPEFCSPVSSSLPLAPEINCTLFADIPDEEEHVAEAEIINGSAPKATRSIIDDAPLSDLISKHCVCKDCGGELSLSFTSIGIATTPSLHCIGCKTTNLSQMEGTNIPKGKHPRQTDHSVNCQFVAACISCGDGGVEAGRMLGLLDLPNYATMEKHTFPNIERMISSKIQEVAKLAMEDNLREEVRLSAAENDDFDVSQWEAAIRDNTELPKEMYAQLSGGTDMGWQKRSSGRQCDSLSGHELFVGARTRKPTMMCLKSKFCRVCSAAKAKGIDARAHDCRINHVGSSGSMEANALVEMTHKLHHQWKVHLKFICTDDDSTMKARLRWSNQDHFNYHGSWPTVEIKRGKRKGQFRMREDNGKLLGCIPEPKFVADPAHRKKTLRNRLCAFEALPAKQTHGFGPADITRLTKNFAYFVNNISDIDHSDWVERSKCALDHHFDDHANCGSFCLRKKELKEKSEADNKKKFYRDKVKDEKLYSASQKLLADFTSLQRLEEVGHGMDTQPNEAINNTTAWFAPKGKTHCGSASLENRVCMAISTHLIGPQECFTRLYSNMGVEVRHGTAHCLRLKNKASEHRRQNQKKVEVKKKRNEKNFDKLRDQLKKQLKGKKEENEHAPGVAMDVVELQVEGNSNKVVCNRCGGEDHQRKSSKKCPCHKDNDAARVEAEQQALLDLVDVDESHGEVTDNLLKDIEGDEDEEVNYEDESANDN